MKCFFLFSLNDMDASKESTYGCEQKMNISTGFDTQILLYQILEYKAVYL